MFPLAIIGERKYVDRYYAGVKRRRENISIPGKYFQRLQTRGDTLSRGSASDDRPEGKRSITVGSDNQRQGKSIDANNNRWCSASLTDHSLPFAMDWELCPSMAVVSHTILRTVTSDRHDRQQSTRPSHHTKYILIIAAAAIILSVLQVLGSKTTYI